MSSSEEYLDSLLRAIMEGNTNEEPSPSMMQDVTDAEDDQGTSVSKEPDTMVGMDDNETMFPTMDEETAKDEMQETVSAGEEMMSDEPVLDGSMISDDLLLDDGMLPDGLSVDEGNLIGESDETMLDDNLLSDELPISDEVLPDDLALDDGMLTDDLPLDVDMPSDGLGVDNEAIADDLSLIETDMDDFAWEESVEESTAADDLSLDELGLGDLGLEDLGLEDLDSGEIEQEELELNPDSAPEDELEEGGDFALEDVTEENDSFALEETGEDDADLSALLASMGADDDLSEINDLLEKSDQGVMVDDDLMAMLDSVSDDGDDSLDFLSIEGDPDDIREITQEELEGRGDQKSKRQKKKEAKERKKKEKQAKKVNNKNAGDGDALLESVDEAGDKQKKKGVLSKFVDFLLEEEEEEDAGGGENPGDAGSGLASLTEENKELLAELNAEDKKNAKKKDKKEKKAKKDKGKGKEKAEAKPKKPKKEKVKKEKKKKEKHDEEPQVPEKKLSKKKVVTVFIFCATIAACIIVMTILMPEQIERQQARVAFDQSQYTQVYELLYGKELSEEDEVLMQKSSTILKLQRKFDSYENYSRMNMPLEALDALLDGVNRYQILRGDAELNNVSDEVVGIYGQILDALEYNYGLSEADALDIIASEDDITYSRRVQAVVSGDSFGMDEPILPEEKQDVLPEEEEIIDRLGDTETE